MPGAGPAGCALLLFIFTVLTVAVWVIDLIVGFESFIRQLVLEPVLWNRRGPLSRSGVGEVGTVV